VFNQVTRFFEGYDRGRLWYGSHAEIIRQAIAYYLRW
jgi:hypothetical protein